MNKKFWITLEAIMLIIWIVTTCFFIYTTQTKSIKCLANPLVFGAKHLSELNDAEFTCQCEYSNEPDYFVNFNKEKWWVEARESTYVRTETEIPDYLKNLNFTVKGG